MVRQLISRRAVWGSFAVLAVAVIGSSVSIKTRAAAKSPAGFYRGKSNAKRVVNLNVARLVSTYDSDFWFTLDAQGNADGYAMARYDVTLDDARLRSLLGLASSLANFPLMTIPGVGGLIGTGANATNLVGVRTSYDQLMPVREGRIRGRSVGGQLHLEWVSTPPEIPYTTYRVYTTREDVMRQETAPAYNPWTADARFVEAAPGQWQAFVLDEAAHRTSGNAQTFAFWTAHRVGAAE